MWFSFWKMIKKWCRVDLTGNVQHFVIFQVMLVDGVQEAGSNAAFLVRRQNQDLKKMGNWSDEPNGNEYILTWLILGLILSG